MTVGEKIKEKRIALGMSQDELAQKVGYKSRSSINKIELARDLPLSKVEKMARALGTTPSYLMGWNEKASQEDILLQKYNGLNEEGKEKLIDYADYLLSKEEYLKEMVDVG